MALVHRLFHLLCLGLVVLSLTTPVFAVNPDEMLSDPALEQRARAISAQLRCMVCQNESIDDSNAELARDLRVLVRDRLKNGDSDQQVMDYIVSRYGEFILLKPRFAARTLLLWTFPVIVLLIGGLSLLYAFKRRQVANPGFQPLSAQEREALERLLKQD
ncbi:cytochrome c-type biogenesis protein [Daeguia caeni]|uniref:Cytochrome c-type biogenesis protein n=1 Tax=Daeguia caeni TaxID=439612 RepID=A0ABV9H6W1_9HYPH